MYFGQNKMHSSRVSLKEPPSAITSCTVPSKFKVLCRWDIPTKQGWSFHPKTLSTLSHKCSFWKYKHFLSRLGKTERKGTFPGLPRNCCWACEVPELSMQISNQRGDLGHKRLSDIHRGAIHPNISEVNHHSVWKIRSTST